MGRGADEGDNNRLSGKLGSPFDDRGDEGNDGANSKVPGKLSCPSEDGTKQRDDSFKRPQRNRGATRRRKTEGKKASPDDENMVDNEENP